ncbi:carboxymuconolactone decarboxylase family protein [Aliiroseovarius sp. KMU-50]|uniref:Carboxymuconolactone decarboxylase family protein n=1 Tax=Aliiroseovarius salicola TaxID=3009082 RepID=A0ABT4VWZ4_9RHOB|nr:carboxymuconolactone decarboxylase family protein [Aliiroseovarius sp. KMU-50]MDA5092783.1 carboxymuconolactone decarboxylase family protein [Aliiroseovarius sp. KMU-50]
MPYNNETMTNLAPEVRNIFDQAIEKKGFVPNVLSIYGPRPELLGGIAALSSGFGAGQLTDAEREVVFLSTSVANKCRYCVAGHTYYGLKAGVDAEDVDRMRRAKPISNARYEALRVFSQTLALNRGHSAKHVEEQFQSAGYTRSHTFDVIVGVAAKTLSNMTASLLDLPLDEEFKPYGWSTEQAALQVPIG